MALVPFILSAQERCATGQIAANQYRPEKKQEFENWLKNRVLHKQQLRATHERLLAVEDNIYRVPVVFHVIYRPGENEIGKGSNINTEKIQEQVEILNKDFRRLNEDTTNTPAEFRALAADTRIEFVLAKRDPEGAATTGIVRLEGDSIYAPGSDDAELKSLSFWPPEDYLNIYITALSSGNLGYAQFPFSNLEGIASELENYRNTDGVVLDYKWVGLNEATGSFDSHGRTATHEIGHYLGLRHIWGDSRSCSVDDFCNDTPLAESSTSGCSPKEECGSRNMMENYMDYTDDECMNLFTTCQRERMRTVLEFSPRRRTLLTSPALLDPIYVANDLGIQFINSPEVSDCDHVFTPGVRVKNYGNNSISSFTVGFYLNNVLVETFVSTDRVLGLLEPVDIAFSEVEVAENEENSFTFIVTNVNGVSDGNAENNTRSTTLLPTQTHLLPYVEDFEGSNSFHKMTKNGGSSLWSVATASDSLTTNTAAVIPFYEQSANFGIQDLLLTKILDLSPLSSSARLKFRYAYAHRLIEGTASAAYLDGLIVAISTDCGNSFHRADYLFEKYGKSLATIPAAIDTSFTTSSFEDWKAEEIDLIDYVGLSNLQIAFIGVNGGGNNLYLDDVMVEPKNIPEYDVGIRKTSGLSPVLCSGELTTSLEVTNFGKNEINEVHLTVSINGSDTVYHVKDLSLAYSRGESVSLDFSNKLVDGVNEVTFAILDINGMPDENTTNDHLAYNVIIDDTQETIPANEDFEPTNNWIITHPASDPVFDTVDLGINNALMAKGFESMAVGAQSYLVSPVLQTGNYNEASLRFKYSYARRGAYNDNLKILLSTDCGKSYPTELFNQNSEKLALVTSNSPWVPETDNEDHWKEIFLDISKYVTYPELRIAFVFTNGNGNNLYIDDIDVLTTSNPNLPNFDARLTIYPNPATGFGEFYTAFKLPEKQPVRMQLVDMIGRVVFDGFFPDTINQTYTLKAPSQGGLYLLRVTGKDVNLTKRIHIKHQ